MTSKKLATIICQLLLTLSCFIIGCQPQDIPSSVIDPTSQPSAFSRALLIRGAASKSGPVPSGRLDSDIKIEKYQTSASVTNNNSLFVPFLFSAGIAKRVKGLYLIVEGADNYWDIPIQVNTTIKQAIVLDLGIPSTVKPGNFTMSYRLHDDKGNMSNEVELDGEIVPTEEFCQNGGSSLGQVSGNDGITVRSYQMGNQPGWVTIKFNTYTVPDRIDIRYGNEWVRSTGSLLNGNQLPPIGQCNQVSNAQGFVGRTGEFNIYYDPKVGRQFDIYVSGCLDGGTQWNFEVTDCPSQRPMLGIHSSEPPTNCFFDCNKLGHAWVSLTDNGKTTCYGLWPDTHEEVVRRNLANGKGTDVRMNIEGGSGEINRYYLLTAAQLKRFEQALQRNRTYSLVFYNCASFASDMVAETVEQRLNPVGFVSGRPTPCTLSEQIRLLNTTQPTDVNYNPIGIKFSTFNRSFCE